MLIGIHDEEILNTCFKEWLYDHSEVKNNDELRCAIVAYSLYVQHILADLYDVGVEEGEYDEN